METSAANRNSEGGHRGTIAIIQQLSLNDNYFFPRLMLLLSRYLVVWYALQQVRSKGGGSRALSTCYLILPSKHKDQKRLDNHFGITASHSGRAGVYRDSIKAA